MASVCSTAWVGHMQAIKLQKPSLAADQMYSAIDGKFELLRNVMLQIGRHWCMTKTVLQFG